MASGWYELSKGSDGQFHFVLKASNGEIILTSQRYNTKASAENGIYSVQANCALDERFERKASSNGKPYFDLKAANNQIIGVSQLYESERSRDEGIASVKVNGSANTVKDLS